MMYKYYEWVEGVCSLSDYCGQYLNTVTYPKVGNVYVQKDNLGKTWFEIIFADEKQQIALGVVVKDTVGGLSIGRKCLFYYGGAAGGFKYQDVARPSYRLQYQLMPSTSSP